MNINLLNKILFATSLGALLSACGGGSKVNSGYDPQFGSVEPVEFENEVMEVTFEEDSGIQSIDLFAGATVAGKPIIAGERTYLIRSLFFGNAGVLDTEVEREIFELQDNILTLDTDVFGEVLQRCGSRTSHTYEVEFILDVGFDYPIGAEIDRRRVDIIVNGADEPVVGIWADDLVLPTGSVVEASAGTLPAAACNDDLTWAITDNAIATVDAGGNVTGLAPGETIMTVTHTPAVGDPYVMVVNVEVTDPPRNVESISTRNVAAPACSTIGVPVEPVAMAGQVFMGEFVYAWMPEDPYNLFNAVSYADKFGLGMFVNNTTNVDVGGANSVFDVGVELQAAESNVLPAQVTVELKNNLACEERNPTNNALYLWDHKLESLAMGGGAQWINNPGGFGTMALAAAEGLNDSNALEITVTDPAAIDVEGNGGLGMVFRKWGNTALNSFWAYNFGREHSVGLEFGTSVWVKLNTAEPLSEEITLTHYIFPWLRTGHNNTDWRSWSRRDFPGNAVFQATLKNTNKWQLVEFKNTLQTDDTSDDIDTFTIPSGWDGYPTAVKPQFVIRPVSAFSVGDTILFDDYSIIVEQLPSN